MYATGSPRRTRRAVSRRGAIPITLALYREVTGMDFLVADISARDRSLFSELQR